MSYPQSGKILQTDSVARRTVSEHLKDARCAQILIR